MHEHSLQKPEPPLMELWRSLWNRKKLVAGVVLAASLASALYSLTLPNVYEAQTVIAPAANDRENGGMQAVLTASGMGNLASLSGMPLAAGVRLLELEQHLRSNIVREKLIVRHDLLPVLFRDSWDAEKRAWKQPGPVSRLIGSLRSMLSSSSGKAREGKASAGPSVWDGLRSLENVLRIRSSIKENIITIKADLSDPEAAAAILTLYLQTLQDHLRDESQRVAKANKKYLNEQLLKAVDPVTRQKIYHLLSKQIETELLADVKENSAFMIIDPPRAPDRKVGPRRMSLVIVNAFISLLCCSVLIVILDIRMRQRRSNP